MWNYIPVAIITKKINNVKKCKKSLKNIKINNKLIVSSLKDFEIVENLNQKTKSKNIIYSPEVYDFEEIEKGDFFILQQAPLPS